MADTVTWWFDRLGENLDPPTLIIPATVLGPGRLIQEHALKHIIVGGGFRIAGPAIRPRTLGGYQIVDLATNYVYGHARKSPVFVTKSYPVLPPPLMIPRGRMMLAREREATRD